jgi:hypothetical protein
MVQYQLEITFEKTVITFSSGDGIFIPDGPENKHMGKLISEKALVFFVEDC